MMSGLLHTDYALFSFLNNYFVNEFMDVAMGLFTQFGTVRVIFPLAGIILYFFDRNRFTKNMLFLASILFIEIFAGQIIKDLADRPRPLTGLANILPFGQGIHMVYVKDHFPFFSSESPGLNIQKAFGLGPQLGGGSFPSGHAQGVFAVATFFAYLMRKYRFYLYSVAVVSAFSRIYVGVHYPSDVLGGALLGFLIASVIIRRIEKAGGELF